MSEDKRAPRARVESADRDDVVEADAHVIDDETAGGQKASGGFDGSATETFRDTGKRMGGWVSRTFPGHEHAFWGGVLGLLVAVLVFWIGILQALVVAVIVLIGVALGQVADGDPKIINLIRRFFASNS